MDRNNRDGRRASVAVSNGLARRRHRSNSLRDSPEEDGQVELQEAVRIRDRKKNRDRDRSNLMMSKRRRNDGGGGGGGDESTEESVNDDEDEDLDDRVGGVTGGSGVRMLPPNPVAAMYSSSNHHHQHQTHHHQQSLNQNQNQQNRKSFPPAAATTKNFKPVQPWLATEDKIGVSVPRKARSASTKRSHECWASSGGGSGGSGVAGDQIPQQESASPVRASLVSASPVSPSSSSISARKKMKSNGHKQHRPPIKTSSKSSSSNQDEIEIEIAEVLYGMMRQPQGPSKQEIMATTATNESIKFDSREVSKTTTITTSGDAKSRVSSPISNLPSSAPAALHTQNSSSVAATPIAPKRKRPRQVSYNEENPVRNNNNPIAFNAKPENDHPAKNGSSLPILEKNAAGAGSGETGLTLNDLPISKVLHPPVKSQQDVFKVENRSSSTDLKPLNESSLVVKEGDAAAAAANSSEKNGSNLLRYDGKTEDSNKPNSTAFGVETKREEKFQIDLMAPPFQMMDGDVNYGAVEPKPMISHVESEKKFEVKEDLKSLKLSKDDLRISEPEEKKVKATVENAEPPPHQNKDRFIDLHLDLEKNERDATAGGGSGGFNGNKLFSQNASSKQQHQQQQLLPKPIGSRDDPPPSTEKTAQPAGSVPLQMSMANWPPPGGGLPPMGYMTPLHQVVVPMDGSAVSPATVQPPHAWPFANQGTKRCATHCYIARAIHYNQRIPRMNPFMPPAAGSAPLYGSKPGNLNVMPSSELHGNIQGRAMNSVHEKGHGVAMFPGHVVKDKASQTAASMEAANRKQQIVLQQGLPPGAPTNILHGPAFIFPMGQPPGAPPNASLRPPGSLKSPAAGASSNVSSSAPVSAAATGVGPQAGTPMSFNYPNMATTNDGQYLAILQNGGYPFPIPAHVGGQAAAYRGNHPQAMPFFNGSYYSPQMLHHPSQAQPQQQPPPSQAPQVSQGHQNPTISSSSSSSHKHLHNIHQRPHGGSGGGNGGGGNMQGYSAAKNQPPQQQHNHQNQRLQLPRQLEGEVGGEDSPSTADSRGARANMNVYGQNFAMPMHPQNFALMTQHPASMSTVGANEKKQQQQPQPPQNQGLKAAAGVESLSSPAFAMSFASFGGAAAAANSPGFDISSMAQNHTILQNFPDARHGYHQMMAAAHASQQQHQKKSFRASDEQKNGGGSSSSNGDEERKSLAGKAQGSVGSQSIAFSRPDLPDTSGPPISVIDSSSRSLGLGVGSNKTMGSNMPPAANSHQQHQQQQQQQQQQQRQQQYQHHQQQMIQLQKQQSNYVAAAARNKMPSADHLPSSSSMSSSMSAKFSNPLSAYPQNIVQSSASPTQSPQWKNSTRATTPSSQGPSPAISASTNSSSLKNISHQPGRTQQQTHTQISFTSMPKSSPPPSSSQAPSPPPMAVGSPTHSSMSKGSAGGGSRPATAQSAGNKGTQVSALPSQQGKSLPAAAQRKSSPVGGRTVPSILGNKTQLQPQQTSQQQSSQQQQQQHQQPNPLAKQAMQQAQLFFSNPYMQNQAPNSTMMAGSTGSATSGYYTQQRRRSEQHHHQPSSQQQNSPVSLATTATSDPAKAAAAASSTASNMKGSVFPSQGNAESPANPHQHVSAGFSYAHVVPTAVQVKAATEQKQPAGE